MEKSSVQKIRLGLFVILGLVLLMLAVYFIGNKQSILGGSFKVKAVFKNVNGLQTGNNVRFSGITVGTVQEIEMLNDTTIIVIMTIDDAMQQHLRKNAIAAIGSDGLVGSMIVNISPGAGQAAFIEPGDQLRSYSRIASEDMLNTLSVTNENAAQLTADLLQVTKAVLEGKGTVGKLLNDTAMAGDMYLAINNLKGISEEVNLAMAEVRALIATVNPEGGPAQVLLSDTAAARRVRNIIANLDSTTRSINIVVENLDQNLQQLRQGGGAFGYLSNDSNLVSTLDSTFRNIEKGTARFNENMEALQHNFLLRPYFRKKAREEERARRYQQ